jgi:Protein of unknown function (DUF3987)
MSAMILALQGHGEPHDFMAVCPAHRDVRPSLHVTIKDGAMLVHCFAGCTQDAVIDALRKQGLWPEQPRPEFRKEARRQTGEVVAKYDYVTADGELVHQTLRLEPKSFRQRRPAPETGLWIWGLTAGEYMRMASAKDWSPFKDSRFSEWPIERERRTFGAATLVLYRLPAVLKAVADGETIYLTEGEKDADSLAALGLVATTNAMGAGKWTAQYSEDLRGADVVLLPHNDAPGRDHAERVAAELHGVAKRMRMLDIAKHWPQCPEKGDISDWIAAGGKADKLVAIVEALPDLQPTQRACRKADDSAADWPEPKRLPSGLPPVEPFSFDFLPEALAPWIEDIANRLQCPPDYVAVAALTSLGAVIGRRIGIKPQAKTDWVEIPNVWGCFIGRPGMLKSPAMNEALRPIHHLEAEAAKENEIAQQAYAVGLDAYKLRREVSRSLLKDKLKAGKSSNPDIKIDFGEEPKEPAPIRFRTNDSSYEKLGELLMDNPAGILIERDELVSLLQHLDRDDQSNARGFYLSGWSGQQPYTFDRIIRGHNHIDAVCLSVLGNTQPARIAEYIHRANYGGTGGDGLIQRFSLLVWPDAPADWKDVDEYPNRAAREKVWEIYQRLSKLDALKLGAEKGPYDKVPALRFDQSAQGDFLDWRTDLERQVRSGELSPSFEGHLAKYRKLVPTLALMNHLADGGIGSVSQRALLKALAMAHYLKSHARRVYGSADEAELAAAKAILRHIRAGDLKDGFTARDVHQHNWAHLTEREQVGAGLRLLDDLDYIAVSVSAPGAQGGRPKTTYCINPRLDLT